MSIRVKIDLGGSPDTTQAPIDEGLCLTYHSNESRRSYYSMVKKGNSSTKYEYRELSAVIVDAGLPNC
jgi:hypothetical protein